jgi:hypothetical protein
LSAKTGCEQSQQNLRLVAYRAGIQDVDLLPDAAGGGLNVIQLDFGLRDIPGVHENSGRRGMGPQLTQQLQPLRLYLALKRAHTCDVAARMTQAGDEAAPNRVGANHLLSTVDQKFVNGVASGTAVVAYVHPDHLGSTNVVTDANQNLVQTLDY